MAGRKAKKATDEIAWRSARGFVRSLEKWASGGAKAPMMDLGGKKRECLGSLGLAEKRWIRSSYKKAGKAERRLFLKSALHFMYLLGVGKAGCANLEKILKAMGRDRASPGEFYEYVLQSSGEALELAEGKFGRLASGMEEAGIAKEYYKWFGDGSAPQGRARGQGIGRIPPSTQKPAELRKSRKKVDLKALVKRVHAPGNMAVGSAALSRISGYLRKGRLTKLVFENGKTAKRVANLLHESGVDDISVSGRRVSLGLRETIYNAKRKVIGMRRGDAEYPLEAYISYFRKMGIDSGQIGEIEKMHGKGDAHGALEGMCRAALQGCKRQYLIMGEKRHSFGEAGEKMISAFKERVGGAGESSLMDVYDMMGREEYPSALERLRKIFRAIEWVRGEYPHMF